MFPMSRLQMNPHNTQFTLLAVSQQATFWPKTERQRHLERRNIFEKYKFWKSLQSEIYLEKKCILRKRVTEGNIWIGIMMPALHVDFGGVHVSLLFLLTCFCIVFHFTASPAAAPTHLQKHIATVRISDIAFVIAVNFHHPSLPQQDLLMRKHTSTYLLEHFLKN